MKLLQQSSYSSRAYWPTWAGLGSPYGPLFTLFQSIGEKMAISREKKLNQILVWISRHDLPDSYDVADDKSLQKVGYYKKEAADASAPEPLELALCASTMLELAPGRYRVAEISLEDQRPCHRIGDEIEIKASYDDGDGTHSTYPVPNWCISKDNGGSIATGEIGTYVIKVVKISP